MRFLGLFAVLASGFAVTAFSLDKRVGVVASAKLNTWKNLPSKESPTLLLKHSQLFTSSRDDLTVNMAAKDTQGKNKGLFGSIWNENTKLAFNLAVWYLGNIYCKLTYGFCVVGTSFQYC